MTIRSLVGVSLIVLSGCASIKELVPNPAISPAEGQFRELKNKDENFKLKQDDRYVVSFPKPESDNFYLVLVGNNKPKIHTYLKSFFDAEAETLLTRSFGFKEGAPQIIQDETVQNDSILLYPIDSSSASYSWIIDTVREDVELGFRYRYVKQWRYTYELERARIDTIWRASVQDRKQYAMIAPDYNTDALDDSGLINLYTPTYRKLLDMQKDVQKLAQILPPEIKKTGDSTYTEYMQFSAQVDDELLFQKNFLDALTVLKIEKGTRGNIAAFLQAAPAFIKYFTESKQAPPPLAEKIRKILSDRLDEVLPFYDAALKKSSAGSNQSFSELANCEKLFAACDHPVPEDLKRLIPFVQQYSEEWESMQAVDATLAALDAEVAGLNDRPADAFYQRMLSLIDEAQNNLPESEARSMEKYGKYKCSIMLDQRITNAKEYLAVLKEQMKALRIFDQQMRLITTMLGSVPSWPADAFYGDLMNHLDEMKNAFPKSSLDHFDAYSNSKTAGWAAERLNNAVKQESDFRSRYQKANELVRQINVYKSQGNNRAIIRLLNANRTLSFLLEQYPDIDTLSLGTQTRALAAALSTHAWRSADSKIDDLFRDKEFVNPDAIAEKKMHVVKHFETELYQKVDSVSHANAEAFINANELTVKNIPALYKDSSFLPVYKLQFSSTGQKDLQQKQKHVEIMLTELKNVRFPETAVKALYRELTRNILDQGVERARAIAEHGKFYKGSDKQVRNLVDECDYSVAKIYSKPSEYRKFFVLPVTSNKKGMNDYILRLELKIPSEAEFPIFDINVTVPREFARTADQPWFQEISINKKPIKNEGRFHITAPTSSNNYESQITPIQIDKDGNNIFEIKLKYDGLRVFEMSVMAQKPIIRKN
ncbi:MAG TPA: hypothetical protein VMU30_00035 [Bacteroidota bacterium]|nr:hypothetical protein [Bacteroidota bacterium]